MSKGKAKLAAILLTFTGTFFLMVVLDDNIRLLFEHWFCFKIISLFIFLGCVFFGQIVNAKAKIINDNLKDDERIDSKA